MSSISFAEAAKSDRLSMKGQAELNKYDENRSIGFVIAIIAAVALIISVNIVCNPGGHYIFATINFFVAGTSVIALVYGIVVGALNHYSLHRALSEEVRSQFLKP